MWFVGKTGRRAKGGSIASLNNAVGNPQGQRKFIQRLATYFKYSADIHSIVFLYKNVFFSQSWRKVQDIVSLPHRKDMGAIK
jgi:hypothetical protein